MGRIKKLLSKNNFGHFCVSYIIVEAITIGIYTAICLVLSPIVLGTIIEYSEKNAASYVPGQNPFNIGVDIFLFLLFYVVLSVVYLYRDKERRLAYFKATVADHQLKRRIQYYMTEFGLMDIAYYCVISIPVGLILRGTFESMILFWAMPVFLHYVLSYLLFAVIYTCCVMIVTTIWEKNRPDYLTKDYKEKSTET